VVREQIKSFAQKKVSLPPGKTKIIFLDEADSLTEGAQHALRMIISNFSETTRFVLSCNTSSKIIEPIQSRCIILRFGKLRDNEVELNLKRIIEGENVKITEQAFRTLQFIADGDMRQAINNIQACHFASQGNSDNTQAKPSPTKQFFTFAMLRRSMRLRLFYDWLRPKEFIKV
jgi:replication factor C subunit 2/4